MLAGGIQLAPVRRPRQIAVRPAPTGPARWVAPQSRDACLPAADARSNVRVPDQRYPADNARCRRWPTPIISGVTSSSCAWLGIRTAWTVTA